MNKSLAFAASLALVCSTAAMAANHDMSKAPSAKASPAVRHAHALFAKLDRNKDGHLDKKEAGVLHSLSREFSRIAKDGKLELAAFTKWDIAHRAAYAKHHHKASEKKGAKKS
ncbi:MAG: hypothetical protein WCC36_14990 [Gammaproteobacteria bacterium]